MSMSTKTLSARPKQPPQSLRRPAYAEAIMRPAKRRSLILLVALLSSSCLPADCGAREPPAECRKRDAFAIDCHPEPGASEPGCAERGCCWARASVQHQGEPSCYFGQNSTCYLARRAPPDEEAERAGRLAGWSLEWSGLCRLASFGAPARRLELQVTLHNPTTLNVRLAEPAGRRRRPGLPLVEPGWPSERWRQPSGAGHPFGFEEVYSAAGQLQRLRILHQPSGSLLLELELAALIYSAKLVQLTTYLPSGYVYGLGQHFGESLLKRSGGGGGGGGGDKYHNVYTMFNRGQPPAADSGAAYASYPFYINLLKLKSNGSEPAQVSASGAFMLNSQAMDVALRTGPSFGSASVTWRLLAGLVDLFVFAGPSPHAVVAQFQELVGRPAVPPSWALGFHQSRLNYQDLLQVKLAWARSRDIGLPVEAIWADLDFLWRGTSYTVREPQLNELVQVLHERFDMHFVVLVDPAISAREDLDKYEALKLAQSLNLFASYPSLGGRPALVRTWPDSQVSAVLDFTSPHAVNYLEFILADYHAKLHFDGLWLDMNEPEVFENHPMDGRVCPLDAEPAQVAYLPGGRNLSERSLCMEAEFSAGKHFDLHNIYCLYQAKAHFEALRRKWPHRRPFLISRAQFAGLGRYSGAWLGDLASSFEHLRWSLLATIESNWFGQPLTGADICGFFGPSSDELCSRWFSLGSFYPFARSHNDAYSPDQDPGAMGLEVQLAARTGLTKRYSLLPYLYSLFHANHRFGEPVVRSILFEFFALFSGANSPGVELEQLPQIDHELMLGSAFLLAPVVFAGQLDADVYLPPGRWYDVSLGLQGTETAAGAVFDSLRSNWPPLVDDAAETPADPKVGRRVANLFKPIDCLSQWGCWRFGQRTPPGAVNVFLRGGSIVPTWRRVDSRKSVGQLWSGASFFLEIALDAHNQASGTLFWDSGQSPPEEEKLNQAQFDATSQRLEIQVLKDAYAEQMQFDGFLLYGARNFSRAPSGKVQHSDATRLVFRHIPERAILTCVFEASEKPGTIRPLVATKHKKLVLEWSDA